MDPSPSIGHGNRDHATSTKRWRLERFTAYLPKPDLDITLNKVLQTPSIGGGCVTPITARVTADFYVLHTLGAWKY